VRGGPVLAVGDPDAVLTDGDTGRPVADLDGLDYRTRTRVEAEEGPARLARYPDGSSSDGEAYGACAEGNRLRDAAPGEIDSGHRRVDRVRDPDSLTAHSDRARSVPHRERLHNGESIRVDLDDGSLFAVRHPH
jgi:hypothetical protein